MDELDAIFDKYLQNPFRDHFETLDELNPFATQFYIDVAEIYDCLTRVRNKERDLTGYTVADAPIIGLLVRIWKLLKETIHYYTENNAEFLAIFHRTLIETAVIATYLLKHDAAVLEDYRKCSYKDRLRILQDAKNGSAFSKTKAGKRLLRSVEEKMSLEGFSENDFAEQKKHRWKLQGKSFFQIFTSIYDEKMYTHAFGMSSESVHCSWNDSMDWCLQRNEDGTFSIYPFYHSADIRFITPSCCSVTTPLHSGSNASHQMMNISDISPCFSIGLKCRITIFTESSTGFTEIRRQPNCRYARYVENEKGKESTLVYAANSSPLCSTTCGWLRA